MKFLRNSNPRSVKIEKTSESESEEPPAKKRKEFQQFPKSPGAPSIPCGEDKASHLRHVKLLQQEERKLVPNKGVVSDLMKRTYPFRRREFLEQPLPITELFKIYPSLKRSDQVRSYRYQPSPFLTHCRPVATPALN